ncbi:Aspartyl/Asparaginyl beta-hydroxylase [Pseudoxanthomonas sp. GM95]|uniref:sulfotransferase family protein n=1 Tax=Pseudoxanthomonas sp. GM95 TaxID=1881043 RepID=UPI0008B87824|nr:sulfotransferase [Pseudoxanthomonas sp. GM95]SEL62594.1 Aspartyl/Asparaginyl beta-hydroxylase [Pseudoxanthomonas sp. GM95]
MKLQSPFFQLPVQLDAEVLRAEVAALTPSAWLEQADGSALLRLVSKHGDPALEAASGTMQATPWLHALPYVQEVLAALGATWGRVWLLRVPAGVQPAARVESAYYHRERMRLHIPVETADDVVMDLDGDAVQMLAGSAWVIDTWRPHRLIGSTEATCIHLLADTVGGAHLWDLLVRARSPGRRKVVAWAPERIEPETAHRVALRFETANVPSVMTPWELREHLMFLLAEAVQDHRLPALQSILLRFSRHWQALWAAYGTDAAGDVSYRALLDSVRAECLALDLDGMTLRNGLDLWPTLGEQVFEVALGEGARKPVGKAKAASRRKRATPELETTLLRAGDALDAPRPAGVVAPALQVRQPLFIVGVPRSGAQLLLSTLAQSPDLVTAEGDTQRVIEGVRRLSPKQRDQYDNRLLAEDALGEVTRRLRQRFTKGLRDRDGRRAQGPDVRLIQAGSKQALRIPFLAQLYPDARFIYLHREPHEALGSMLNSWKSGRCITYQALPQWEGLPWSFALTPDWQRLSGRSLEDIVAGQWSAIADCMLGDLAELPGERWIGVDFDRLLADPQGEVERLVRFAGLAWDRELGIVLPRRDRPFSASAVASARQRGARIAEAHPELVARAWQASLHG